MSATSSPPQAAPASGRRRFWLTVAAFAVANVAAWVCYHQFVESRTSDLLRVERFSHANGGPVSPRPQLTWLFNLDVVPAPDGQAPATLAPAIPGRWDWRNARTLTFTPDADLPKATRFTVTLPGNAERLQTAQGFRLREAYVSTFQTAPLALTQARQAGFDGDRVVLELSFDDAVNAADVMKHLSLTGPDAKPLTFEPHGLADGPIVRVRTAPLPPTTQQDGNSQRTIQVALSPGLAGRSGPLAMTEGVAMPVTVDAELIATDADPLTRIRGDGGIRIEFNNDVDHNLLKPLLSVEPKVEFTVASAYNGVLLSGDFAPGTRYAVKIAAPPAGADKSRYPRAGTLSVFIPDREPDVWFEHDSGYLGSRGNRTLLAHAVNVSDLTVRVTRLYDNNLVEWRNAAGRVSSDAYAAPLAKRSIRMSGKKNEKQDVRISVDEILPAGAAHDGAYLFELVSLADDKGDEENDRRSGRYSDEIYASSVVTLSDIGLSAKRGRNDATVWVTSLSTASPVENVRVRVFSNKNQPLGEALSGQDGLARVSLAAPAEGETAAVIVADRAGAQPGSPDITWLDLRTSGVTFAEADIGGRAYLRTGHEAFVYTDRGVYRPGETVHLRTIVRGPDNATPAASFPVLFQIVRPDLRNWRAQTTPLDADGAAGFELALPTDLPTGRWTANVGLPGDGASKRAKWLGTVAFQVEEFVPDRMKVEMSLGAEGTKDGARHTLGDAPLRASVQADYLFGRPVANRPATLVARVDPAEFRPSGWNGWTFDDASDTAGPLGIAKPLGRRRDLPVTDLNATGHAAWEVEVRELITKGESVDERKKVSGAAADGNAAYPGPWTLTTTASVAEEGGRAVSATKKLEVDLAPYYVGVRRPSQLVQPKSPCAFEIATVSPATAKTVSVDAELQATLFRESWNNSLVRDKGHYRYEATRILEPVDDEGAVTVTLSDGRGTCSVVAPTGGSYVLRVNDVKSGVVTSVSFYAGDNAWDDQISREDPERLELVLLPPADGFDAFAEAFRQRDFTKLTGLARNALQPSPENLGDRTFAVGERPRVLVRSPFKGQLLLNVEADSVVSSQVIDMSASQVTVPIEVTSACLPNAYVTATVIRAIDPDAKWRPHRASGATRLSVDNTHRKLNVGIAAPTEIRPATSLTAEIRVTDSAGRAVPNAAITVAAVDEGICRLTNFKTPDPFAFFTATRALAVKTSDLYGQLMPEVRKPDATSTPGGDDGADDADDSRYRSPIAAKRVRPVALFSGVTHAGPDGVARVSFPVPHFSGELRLMAVAYTGGNDVARPGFGSAHQPVAVRSPLIVQSSWPRFAAPGDRFAVPFVVFNNGPSAGDVKLGLDVDGPLKFASGDAVRAARSIRVEAGGQSVEVIDVVALERIGVSRIRLVATLDGEAFEESVELPIRPASPAITRGGFASATPDKPAALEVPPGMLDGTAKFQVNVTPWPALELPQGLAYLDRYPYGCAEQTISTLLPLVYLGDIGDRVAPHLFDRDRVKDKVRAGVIRLLGMRTADGGVAMWPGERATWPWASLYAAHFAVEARAAGHEVPDDLYDGLIAYARGLLSAAGTYDVNQLETQAYACYVLALAGKPERAAMSRLAELLSSSSETAGDGATPPPAHARLHVAAAWVAAGRKDLAEAMIPKVLPAPRATRQRTGNVGSPTRDRAVMLTALLAAQPNCADLPAIAQQLADDGRHGRWQSTQDTAFAVMALGRYLKHGATAEPYTSVELWKAGKQVATATSGQPIAWTNDAAAAQSDALEVRVAGPAGARAHVSWLQVGVPSQPPGDAASGMKLRRRYLDDRGIPLRGDAVRSGDLVKVELTIESDNPLENVVIEDLLPAGLEIENPRLVTQAGATAPVQAEGGRAGFEPRRVDMRDDRLILVGDLARAGPATYVYTARAVSRGTFVVPPVRAECMYDVATCAVAGGGGTLRVVAVGKTGIADVGRD